MSELISNAGWPRGNNYFSPPLSNEQVAQVQQCINDALEAAGYDLSEPVWEYGIHDPETGEVDPAGDEPIAKEDFSGIDWEATGERIVRRRKAGPWELFPDAPVADIPGFEGTREALDNLTIRGGSK